MQVDGLMCLVAVVVESDTEQCHVHHQQRGYDVAPEPQIGQAVVVLKDELQRETPVASVPTAHYSRRVRLLQGSLVTVALFDARAPVAADNQAASARPMPELPEVDTTRLGLEPLLVGQRITGADVRQRKLRWPVDTELASQLRDQSVRSVTRRGKYLLVTIESGALLIHLGMSGSLRFLPEAQAPSLHDHIDLLFASGAQLRFNDPRRFGSMHFSVNPHDHWLLRDLGPEPLAKGFSADYLWKISRGRRIAIKQLLMNGRIVVGVGNIYASEGLFRAGIHPRRAAGRIARCRYGLLIDAVKAVLDEAIRAGGTTLRDFSDGDGRPGYFQRELLVYGREGEPCVRCATSIIKRVLGQRATFYCPSCQR